MKKKVLISASLFHALNDATAVTVPMIFPLLFSQQFIIKRYSHIGILSNLGLFVTFLFQIVIAHHAHKFEYRRMLLLSILGISVSLLLITLSGNFLSMLLFYLLMRVFISLYHPVGIATVSRTHPDQGLDFAMGIQSGSGNLGVFVAFILAGFLAQNFGWKMPLYACAMISFALGLSSFLFVRNISLKREQSIKPDFASWIRTLKDIKSYVLGFVFGGACWGTTVYYAPSLFNHKFKVPLGKTGVFLASWIGIGTVMTYSYGYLSKRIGREKASIASFIGSTVFLFLLGVSSILGLAVIGLFFYGAFLFLVYPVFQSFVAKKVPESNHVVAFSIVANIQMLTGSFIVLISGFLSDRFGINSPFLFLTLLGIITLVHYLLPKGSPLKVKHPS
ncbi:MAG: MFS transporter [Candidatus Aminicenantes bacterium]|nr:MFS transporter [Candidatus Aminicenantes bacterium]MDH5384073.1 MFS transporter [Candidatus Aminicenantes bacterium]MDH5744500.1 MFS transporter [Candidatus Aminicenantes bacterium]